MKKKVFTLIIKILIIIILLISVSIFALINISYFQKKIDIIGLSDEKEKIIDSFNPGSKIKLKKFINNFSLEKQTKPDKEIQVDTKKRNKWIIDSIAGKKIINETITFSSIVKPLKKKDKVFFYVYKHKNSFYKRRVILWVPGMGVSKLAYFFIKRFFISGLKNGYDIIMYVPPFHLDRFDDRGDVFFNSNVKYNISMVLNSVKELRVLTDYLEEQGVEKIGGWGGSMGASFLLLLPSLKKLDHISVMIPVVDWTSIFVDNKYMKKVSRLYKKHGYEKKLLRRAYGLISPISYDLKIDNSRFQILYALYDQLTPKIKILNFSTKNKVININEYKKSHATILTSFEIYDDYERFLKNLE